MLTASWVKTKRSEQNWVAKRYLCHIYINTLIYIYKSPYPMFASWLLNFQVNFKKIIFLEPLLKLERLVKEVFFYQNICVLHAKIVHHCHRRRRRKIVRKTANICKLNFFTYNKWKIRIFWESQLFMPKFQLIKKSGCFDNYKFSNFMGKV